MFRRNSSFDEACRDRVDLPHVLERVRVRAADHRDRAPGAADGRHELMDHAVVNRGHRAVEDLVVVEHVDHLADVSRRDVLHPIVLKQMVDREDEVLRFQIGNQLADVLAEMRDLPVLRLVEVVNADVDPLARLGEIGLHFLRDEEVVEVGIFIEEVERAVDGVVVGEGDVRHSPLLGDPVDVFRSVVAVASVRAPEILEHGKAAVTVEVDLPRRGIGDDLFGEELGDRFLGLMLFHRSCITFRGAIGSGLSAEIFNICAGDIAADCSIRNWNMPPKPKAKGETLAEWLDIEVPSRLPVIPLVSSVLFPGGVLSLQVGIERNVRLLRALPEDQNLVAAVLPDPWRQGESAPRGPFPRRRPGGHRTAASPVPDRYQLFLQGRQRIEIVQILQVEPYFEAKLREIPPISVNRTGRIADLMTKAMSLFEKLVESDTRYSGELLNILQMNMQEGPDLFADLIATFLNLPLEEKQRLLETVDPIERLEKLIDFIQRDLGQGDRRPRAAAPDPVFDQPPRAGELPARAAPRHPGRAGRHRIPRNGRPKRIARRSRRCRSPRSTRSSCAARSTASRSSRRLRPTTPCIKGHLDTVLRRCRGPRRPRTGSTSPSAEEILDEKHYGLEKVKERVLEFLAVLKLKGDLKGPILCFAGPPGVGRRRWVRRSPTRSDGSSSACRSAA